MAKEVVDHENMKDLCRQYLELDTLFEERRYVCLKLYRSLARSKAKKIQPKSELEQMLRVQTAKKADELCKKLKKMYDNGEVELVGGEFGPYDKIPKGVEIIEDVEEQQSETPKLKLIK